MLYLPLQISDGEVALLQGALQLRQLLVQGRGGLERDWPNRTLP